VRALKNTRSTIRIAFSQLFESNAQAFPIKLADGECPDTALRAAGTANEPLAAAARRIGQGCLYYLHKLLIVRRKHFSRIAGRHEGRF